MALTSLTLCEGWRGRGLGRGDDKQNIPTCDTKMPFLPLAHIHRWKNEEIEKLLQNRVMSHKLISQECEQDVVTALSVEEIVKSYLNFTNFNY